MFLWRVEIVAIKGETTAAAIKATRSQSVTSGE